MLPSRYWPFAGVLLLTLAFVAVPGSPLDPRAGGTNGLIKDGAIVTTEAADVTAQIAPLIGRSIPPAGGMDEQTDLASAPPPGRSDRELIIEALGPVPTGVNIRRPRRASLTPEEEAAPLRRGVAGQAAAGDE